MVKIIRNSDLGDHSSYWVASEHEYHHEVNCKYAVFEISHFKNHSQWANTLLKAALLHSAHAGKISPQHAKDGMFVNTLGVEGAEKQTLPVRSRDSYW